MLFKEIFSRAMEMVSGGLGLKFTEEPRRLKGEWKMTLRDAASGRVIEERDGSNIIVNSASILIARLLKDSHEPTGGITYLAVGTGSQGWNLQNPPQPTTTQVKLESEIARKVYTSQDISFIDPDTGDPTVVPTNVVDFTVTFAETEAVGPLVEMGMFGGDATDLADSGTEVNYRTFPVLNKLNSMTLTITFRITC